jgi:hypothetical protein
LVKTFDCVNHEMLLLNYIYMEFKECLEIGSGPVSLIEERKLQ